MRLKTYSNTLKDKTLYTCLAPHTMATLIPKVCWVLEHPHNNTLYTIANGTPKPKLIAFTDYLSAHKFHNLTKLSFEKRVYTAPPPPPTSCPVRRLVHNITLATPKPKSQEPRIRTFHTDMLRRRCALNRLDITIIFPDAAQVTLTPDTYGLDNDDIAFHLEFNLKEI